MNTEEYLTTEQVAKLYPFFGYHTLKDLRYKNKSPFPFYKVGRIVRYKKSEIESIINSRKVVDIVEK
jgi:predicted DNA-binding transcriptional regulator AlpA